MTEANNSRSDFETTEGLRINDKPRKHHYGQRDFGDEFNKQRSRYESPENLINFSGAGIKKEKENRESSKFNFESFWRNKIGNLFGRSDDKDEKEDGKNKIRTHNLLEAVTTQYQDDTGKQVLVRCFLLAEGEPQFLELNFAADMFVNPKEKQAIDVNIDIQNIRIEYANDIVKTLAETGYSFRGASALGEVAIAPGPDVF